MSRALHFSRQLVFLFILSLCASLTYAAADATADNKGFLWQISDSNSTLYLLGSVHFANADYYPMNQAIEGAFADADTLAVEVDMTSLDPIKTQQLLQQMGHYTNGRTLQDELSPDTYRMLEQYLANQHIPIHLVNTQKPGMLIMTLTSMELMKLGMLPQFGIDLHFLNRANGSKRIVELETLEQQMDLLFNMEQPDQALRQTLEEFPRFQQLADKLSSAWQSGDTRIMQQLLIDEPLQKYPESKPFFDKMFTDRNLTMTDKIKGYLDDNNTYFVVVGAGHLIGEEGIINLMKEAGFSVKRL